MHACMYVCMYTYVDCREVSRYLGPTFVCSDELIKDRPLISCEIVASLLLFD